MEKTIFQRRTNEIEAGKKRNEAKAVIEQLNSKWQTPFVPRQQIGVFTSGLYSCEYLANLDSLGTGPQGAFKIGRQVVYPLANLTEWLIARIEV